MLSATFVRGRDQTSDVIVEPVLVQPSIRADRTPMERQDSASFSSRACHVTFHTDIVRGLIHSTLFLLCTLDRTSSELLPLYYSR